MSVGSSGMGRPTQAGILFDPSEACPKAYLSRNDHRAFSRDTRRNKWAGDCLPQCEYDLFTTADRENWKDSRPHLWSLKPNLDELGVEGERIALFRDPNHSALPWHGYPVSALDPGRETAHRPERVLIESWLQSRLIDEFQAIRIARGKV